MRHVTTEGHAQGVRCSPATRLVAVLVLLVIEACADNPKATPLREAPPPTSKAEQPVSTTRVVSVGGGVTEIIFALGAGERVVGVDTSSVYPEAATQLPTVGYQRTLSAEGVLALQPSVVVASADAGPPPAIEQLRAAGVSVCIVTADHDLNGARARITEVAEALGLQARGRKLLATFEREVAAGRRDAAPSDAAPKVLIVYARGEGTVNVAGRDTAADEMLRLAGVRNAVTGYGGYKPLTSEAMVAAMPDVVLLPSRGAQSLGGVEGVMRLPGISLTPAGKQHRVVFMDDLMLLGFGPRTGQAIDELARRIQGSESKANREPSHVTMEGAR